MNLSKCIWLSNYFKNKVYFITKSESEIYACVERGFQTHNSHSLQEAVFMWTESPPSNYYIGGSTCIMTSMYRVHNSSLHPCQMWITPDNR